MPGPWYLVREGREGGSEEIRTESREEGREEMKGRKGKEEGISYPHSPHQFLNAASSVQFGSVTQSCPTLCNPMDCSTPYLLVHCQLPELTQTHVQTHVSDAIQPSHPLSSPSPPVFNLSQHQGLFQWVSSPHQVAKGLELQLLISFTMDWFDLLAVQGTLKSLLQHHSSKASILQHSAFFTV